ncbi:MAG: hypothetical protein FWG03_08115 [Clostridiales bacterium]|nr:hypothetical protein [Clostridiales bacterium]
MSDISTPADRFNKSIERIDAAIALKEADRIPLAPFLYSVVQNHEGSSYKDLYYGYREAGDAALRFYSKYPLLDANLFLGFTSGKANELAASGMIDWPGRPGTIVADHCSHQVIEQEYLLAEEYPEFLDDYTGFMLRKYIPRAFPNLKGLSGIAYTPTIVLSTSLLAPMCTPEALEAYGVLAEIAKADAEAAQLTAEYQQKIAELGLPPLVTGAAQAPFDILGDYFRGTMGIFMDQLEREDFIEKACYMFADQQIAALQYFNFVPLPVKRVFFPLHKGMDSFMSPAQFERLYWKPLEKIMTALIEMGVTPILYSEGKYNTRLAQLAEVPKGKVVYHFENVDMKEAKRVLGDTACIMGNLPVYLLEFGKKEEVVDYCKYLIDTCGPGGGYIFDTDAVCEGAKQENLEAMFETFEVHGKY